MPLHKASGHGFRTSFLLLAGWLALFLTPSSVAWAGVPIGLGNGVTVTQLDWPTLPIPSLDSDVGMIDIDLATLRTVTAMDQGFLNVQRGNDWVIQNFPVFPTAEYPYPRVTHPFDLGIPTGTDVTQLDLYVEFSAQPLLTFVPGAPTPFPVSATAMSLGGIPGAPVIAAPSPPPTGLGVIPPQVVTSSLLKTIQKGHPNVNAASNQCMPMAIANSVQFLVNTTALTLSQSHTTGLAPAGVSDGSLVGDIEAETTRAASVVSRTNAPNGTWGLRGKLKFLAKNGLAGKIKTTHFGKSGGSPDGGSATAVSETVGAVTATSTGGGASATIASIIEGLRKGKNIEAVYTFPGGGAHAVDIVAAGVSNGRPWIVEVSDGQQTDQTDPTDTKLGAGDGYVFSWLSDPDGDGNLNMNGTGQELVTTYCQEYVGSNTSNHILTVTGVDDPANHQPFVVDPGPNLIITRNGDMITIDGDGDGFPMTGTISEDGTFAASSISTIAGFSNITAGFIGTLNSDGSVTGGTVTLGALGGLPSGQPIRFTVDVSAPTGGGGAGAPVQDVINTDTTIAAGDLLSVLVGHTLIVQAGAILTINGTLDIDGGLTIEAGSALVSDGVVDVSGSLSNAGSLTNDGFFDVTGSLTNASGATLINQGDLSIQTSGTAQNLGQWTNASGGLQKVFGSLDNAGGSLTNDGIFSNFSSTGTLNTAMLTNRNTLNNFGTLDTSGGTLDNQRTLLQICDAILVGVVTGAAPIPFCDLIAQPSGGQEEPPLQSSALGTARFELDVAIPELRYTIELQNLDLDGLQTPGNPSDDVTGIHIHEAEIGLNGPIRFGIVGVADDADDLIIDAVAGTLTGTWDAADITASDLALMTNALLAGSLYLNVHTTGTPSGEIRGQIATEFVPEPGALPLSLAALSTLWILHRRRRSGRHDADS